MICCQRRPENFFMAGSTKKAGKGQSTCDMPRGRDTKASMDLGGEKVLEGWGKRRSRERLHLAGPYPDYL